MTGLFLSVWAAALCEVRGSADFTLPDGKYVSEFSGKMNVPDLPAKMPNGKALDCHGQKGEPGQCGFSLWPGLEPSNLLFQQFLTNKFDGQWQIGMQYWGCGDTGSTETCHCRDGWCDRSEVDHPSVYPSVNVGDTISWYTKLLSNSTSDNLWYKMGWSSSGGKEQFLIAKANHGGKRVGVLYEGPDLHEEQYWDRLPQTDFHLWDLKLLDQDGQNVGLDWSGCTDDQSARFDCSSSEVTLKFPGASGSSTSCEEKCAKAGHCCTGDVSSFRHPSCEMGCSVSKYVRSIDECQAKCFDNDDSCSWGFGPYSFTNCGDCPSGCDASSGVQECLEGCVIGFSSPLTI